jgi:protein ImuA
VLVAQAERRRAAQEAAIAQVAWRQAAAAHVAGALAGSLARHVPSVQPVCEAVCEPGGRPGGRPEGSRHALDRPAIALVR